MMTATQQKRPIKRINLTPAEQEAMMQAIEKIRERVENDPFHHGMVIIERRGKTFQVFETMPTLFVD